MSDERIPVETMRALRFILNVTEEEPPCDIACGQNLADALRRAADQAERDAKGLA